MADRPYVSRGTGAPVVRVDSVLQDEDSALGLANMIRTRWGSEEHWEAPQILVPVHLLSDMERQALQALQPGGLLTTRGVDSKPAATAGQEGEWFVEGWVETWDRKGNGPDGLVHEVQYAVSDRTRFRADVSPPTVLSYVLNPVSTSAVYGTTRTLTVTVKYQEDQTPVTRGQVALLKADGSPLVSNVTVSAAGVATFTIPGTALNVGTHNLTIKYVGVPNVAQPVTSPLALTVTVLTPAVTLTITPASPVGLGTTMTIKATVAGSAPGVVRFMYAEISDPTVWKPHRQPDGFPLANGVATTTWAADRSLLWRVDYTPTSSNYAAASSAEARVDATIKNTTTTLTLPATVNNGATARLTATVASSPAGGGTPTGSVQFQWSPNGTTWTTWVTVALTNGVAVKDWAANSPTTAWRWRAVYVPATGWAGSTSAVKTIDVLAQTSKTVTYEAAWGASWTGGGSKRTDTADLYQGYWSSNQGNQQSACGFSSRASQWTGYTITKVEMYVYASHWAPSSGGTLVVGSHNAASEPASIPAKTARGTVPWSTKTGGKWVDITSWGKGFATDALDGFTFGPGPSTSQEYYGYMAGTGTNRPKVRITGYRWA